MKKSKIHQCYCQIPEDKLVELADLRFVKKIPTEVLMEKMHTEKDKEYLATVALLDVKIENLRDCCEVENPLILQHLLACRDSVKDILESHGIIVQEKE